MKSGFPLTQGQFTQFEFEFDFPHHLVSDFLDKMYFYHIQLSE